MFISAADVFGDQVVGVVLSGGGVDGAAGLRSIKARGGIALIQLPSEAACPYMPRAAIAAGHFDAVLPIAEIAQQVAALCAYH